MSGIESGSRRSSESSPKSLHGIDSLAPRCKTVSFLPLLFADVYDGHTRAVPFAVHSAAVDISTPLRSNSGLVVVYRMGPIESPSFLL